MLIIQVKRCIDYNYYNNLLILKIRTIRHTRIGICAPNAPNRVYTREKLIYCSHCSQSQKNGGKYVRKRG